MKRKEFLKKYNEGTLGNKTKLRNYEVNKEGTLIYTGNGRKRPADATNPDILAVTLKNGRKLYNASRYQRCGTFTKGTQAPIQQEMVELRLPMVPFNVFTETGLNIQNARVIDQGRPSQILLPKQTWNGHRFADVQYRINAVSKTGKPKNTKTRTIVSATRKGKTDQWNYTYIDKTKLEPRHFVGAMLIKVGHKTFLFDVDNNETKHHRLNAFLVQIKGRPKTIKEAYEGLKPKQVKEAEKKGLKVRRQGEWFFIPTKGLEKHEKQDEEEEPWYEDYDVPDVRTIKRLKQSSKYLNLLPKYHKQMVERFKDYQKALKEHHKKQSEQANTRRYRDGGELRAGNNRPNRVSDMLKVGKKTYVKGNITHTGREHEPIKLQTWHEAIPNTAIGSFTIKGDVD